MFRLAAIPDVIINDWNLSNTSAGISRTGGINQERAEEKNIPVNSSVSAQLKSSSANRIVARSSKSSVVGGNTSSMFGNRYSRSLPSAAGKPMVIKSSQFQQVKSREIVTPNESAASILMQENKEDRSPIDIATENAIVVVQSTEESIEMSDTTTEPQIQKTEIQNEPAFRVKVVECLIFGWPYDGKELISDFNKQSQVIHICDSFISDPKLVPLRAKLIRWILQTSQQEIWSVKRQMILLLGILISRCCYYLGEVETAIQFLVDSYAGNTKHAPVREAVVICFKTILGSIDAKIIAILKSKCAPSVRLLCVSAASDTSTGVLEELQQVKNLWSLIHGAL